MKKIKIFILLLVCFSIFSVISLFFCKSKDNKIDFQKNFLAEQKYKEAMLSFQKSISFDIKNKKYLKVYKDGILELKRELAGNSGLEDWEFVLELEQQKTIDIPFYGYTDDCLIDIDNNGIREFTHRVFVDFGNYLPIEIKDIPKWVDIYSINRATQKPELTSDNYPQYYLKVFVPKLKKSINNYNLKLFKTNNYSEKINIQNAIKANQILTEVAELVINKKVIPDSSGGNISNNCKRILELKN